ncbi:peptidyl-prolyl cis-trans isomerase FKBP8 isoform X2 [Alligator mississippiensis]|uniref:peptidyl-prolyl cis-trans isomerase FKBP8 isoform X2 n=1 Tax=Alligator mississippiensis TaxID=8496 RepID=UPI0028775230|nr:peptidyl-prolyl cis-trans isomerase FKBP8 isoform X2 [Alligator mississippiensis]
MVVVCSLNESGLTLPQAGLGPDLTWGGPCHPAWPPPPPPGPADGALGRVPPEPPAGRTRLARGRHWGAVSSVPASRQTTRQEQSAARTLLPGGAASRPAVGAVAGSADPPLACADDKLLRKRVVQQGRGESTRPCPGQEVTVKLLGVLEDGSLVEKDPALRFTLGQGDVVQALELGVPSMQLGEVSFFLASFQYAYGRLGREPDIPADALLLYEVTLLLARESPSAGPLPPGQRLGLGSQKRERGNFHFEREEYERALRSYRLALRILDAPGPGPASPEEEEEEELRQHRVKCLNNCAAAQLKLQLFEEVLASCDAVLRLDPDNVKALYRKGKLLSERGQDQEAMGVLKRALQLEPTTRAVHAELSKLARRQSGQPEPRAPRALDVLRRRDDPLKAAGSRGTWVTPWKLLCGALAVAVGSTVTSLLLSARS